MRKPILSVDFDGVIHLYETKWQGALVIPDRPVPGAIEWLLRATKWWDIQIYSTRSETEAGRNAMKEWFRQWEGGRELLEHIIFPDHKPPAQLMIEDRAIRFMGNW